MTYNYVHCGFVMLLDDFILLKSKNLQGEQCGKRKNEFSKRIFFKKKKKKKVGQALRAIGPGFANRGVKEGPGLSGPGPFRPCPMRAGPARIPSSSGSCSPSDDKRGI